MMGESCDHGWDRWLPDPSRPPPQPCRRPRSAPVPLWEKRFCTEACGFPWERLCSIQRWSFDDTAPESIRRWDDSAALEALRNAKARYCAAYHGRPCDIPLPDPDIYIDEVDHDAVVDPELMADLDRPPPDYGGLAGCRAAGDGTEIVDGDGVLMSSNWDVCVEQPIQPTGWGDAAEPKPSYQRGEASNGWNSDGWGWDEGAVREDGWRSNGRDEEFANDRRRSPQRGTWDDGGRNVAERGRRNGRKRDGGGRWGPRYTKPKYQTGAYQSNSYHWRTCRGRGSNWTTNHPYKENYP